MALPFVAAIREQLPEVKITIVLNSATCGVLEGAGDVTVLGVDVKCMKLLRPLFLPIRYFRFVRKNLSAQQFDVCFLPRRDADSVYSVLLAYLTRSRRRISFTEGTTPRKAVHNKSFDRLLTDVYPTPPIQHETVSNLSLLESIGLRPISTTAWLPLSPHSRHFAEEMCSGLPKPLVALCPTSGNSELKQWGIGRFCEVARGLALRGYCILLVGSAGDTQLGEAIETAVPEGCVNLIGKTSLTQLAGILSQCAAFIANDAGPMHLASALGIPTVAVFGSSCAHRFGPWSPRSSLHVFEPPCSPCHSHELDRCRVCVHPTTICLDHISPDQVLEAALNILAGAECPLPR